MCGIIGIVGKGSVVPRLVTGLKMLEYRGYDSAGVAVLKEGHLHVRRMEGKIAGLETLLQKDPIDGNVGIGHTRWATHGAPSERNAHPHVTEDVAIVHNGIIENHQELKEELIQQGFVFKSETDSEVVAHLITKFLHAGHAPQEAAFLCFERLEGAFAIVSIFRGYDDLMICVRRSIPLALGVGEGEMYVGSDALALSSLTQTLVYLEEGDRVVLRGEGYEIYDHQNHRVSRLQTRSSIDKDQGKKGNYAHYMLKEIYEQPQVVQRIIETYIDQRGHVQFPFKIEWENISGLTIVACGTSYYAGVVAQNWIERHSSLPVRVEIGSEFRYRQPPLPSGGLTIAISQSGETADTLAALRYAKSQGQKILSLVNVQESSIARESDYVLQLLAGPEIGVASTKAFMAQLSILSLLSVMIAKEKGSLSEDSYRVLLTAAKNVPAAINDLLKRQEEIDRVAHFLKGKKSILYLGRGAQYPIAMEGALKLKELSYLHAEGAPSGELKHGPIALIDDNTPIVFLLPSDELREKNQSNLEEVLARKGKVLLFGSRDCVMSFSKKVYDSFEMPEMNPFFLPLIYTIPVQLLAYKTAILEGNDVDQPRNLAKSVTVE